MTAMVAFYNGLEQHLKMDFDRAFMSPGFQRIIHLGIETAEKQLATIDLGKGDNEVIQFYRQKRSELEFWQELRILTQQHLERVNQNASQPSG